MILRRKCASHGPSILWFSDEALGPGGHKFLAGPLRWPKGPLEAWGEFIFVTVVWAIEDYIDKKRGKNICTISIHISIHILMIYSLEFYFRPSLKSLYSNGSPMDPRLDYLKWLISAMPGAEISRIEGRSDFQWIFHVFFESNDVPTSISIPYLHTSWDIVTDYSWDL